MNDVCYGPNITQANKNINTSDTYAICCNQVIKDWDYQQIINNASGPQTNCTDNYQNTFITSFSEKTYSSCHKPASNQELQCDFPNEQEIALLGGQCPDQQTMVWCSGEFVIYPELAPNGYCDSPPLCCRLYKSEQCTDNNSFFIYYIILYLHTKTTKTFFSDDPDDTEASYYLIANPTNSSNAEQQCLDEYGTHAASIESQTDFIEAYELCAGIDGIFNISFPLQNGWWYPKYVSKMFSSFCLQTFLLLLLYFIPFFCLYCVIVAV